MEPEPFQPDVQGGDFGLRLSVGPVEGIGVHANCLKRGKHIKRIEDERRMRSGAGGDSLFRRKNMFSVDVIEKYFRRRNRVRKDASLTFSSGSEGWWTQSWRLSRSSGMISSSAPTKAKGRMESSGGTTIDRRLNRERSSQEKRSKSPSTQRDNTTGMSSS